MRMTAKSNLLNGTAVYLIGNVISKVMQLLLLPIITKSLLTEEYGYYDLVISTTSLMLPIFTLQLTEALFKFLLKANKKEESETISTVAFFLSFSTLLAVIFILLLDKLTAIIQYPALILGYYVSQSIYVFYQKTARGFKRNKAFAISGVIHTFLILITQVLLLVVFKMRLESLFIANIISNLVSIVYLEIALGVRKIASPKNTNKKSIVALLKFSVPLVPNSISWWALNSINRYFITIFLGIGHNGVYSVAHKIPQLLTFVTSVFQMAWQESAIIESNSENRVRFYSSVFNAYSVFLITATMVLLPLIKLLMPFLVAKEYLPGAFIIPILLMGSVFSSLSQFYGVGYLAFNKTSGAFWTTIVAAVVNCLVSAGLIKAIGLAAPALGTMVAYGTQFFYRIYQMRDYFRLEIKWSKIAIFGIVTLLYTTLYYCINNLFINCLFLLIAFIIFLIGNKEIIKNVVEGLFKGSKRKRGALAGDKK